MEPPTLTSHSTHPRHPRVLILGDSWISGLGVAPEQAFGQLAAESLGAESVLNLSGVSLTLADMVAQADTIREFAPTLAIIGCCGTESLVHAGPFVRNMIDRWGPKSWRGLTGLEPRPYYSNRSGRRLQQRISVTLKTSFKRSIIALTGGQRRISLAETRASMDALIACLGELGVLMVVCPPGRIDDRRFPGTEQAMRQSVAELREALRGRSDAVLVDVWDDMHCWDDYLKDNLHLAVHGHQRVAGCVVSAARTLLAASPSEPQLSSPAPVNSAAGAVQDGCIPPNPVHSAVIAASTISTRGTVG